MTPAKKKVFIFPCGSEVGLELHRALAHSTHFDLIGGSSVPDHGSFAFADHIGELPFIGDEKLLPAVNRIIEDRQVDFIFPAHDAAVTLFSEWAAQNLFRQARVIASPSETCRLLRSKSQTYSRLRDIVPTPLIYNSAAEVQQYPVFLKPDVGQGSKGTSKAIDGLDIEYQLKKDSSLLILEYLPGREYTVDCFTDRHGVLRFSQGRERSRISNGISVNTIKAKDTRFDSWANRINDSIALSGAWFFQVKERKDGEFVLLEVGARIAGTSCYHRAMGVNLPMLSLFDAMGHDIDIFENQIGLEMDRQLFSRYKLDYEFGAIYVDLDDTLIENTKINHRLLGILYRFKSEGKKLYLTTRHMAMHGELALTLLQSHFVDPRLFDEIIEIPSTEKKSSYVARRMAIFVDDSHRERKDVAMNNGIPVFDVDQIIEIFG